MSWRVFFRIIVLIVVIFCWQRFFSNSASAAEKLSLDNTLNITLSPVSMFIDVKPGETYSTQIKIRNNSNQTENLKVSFGTFTSGQGGQLLKMQEAPENADFMKWVIVSPSEFSVNPGEWQTLDFEFLPPKEAGLTYYYSIILTRQDSTNLPGSTNIQGAPAILVLANVQSPNAKKELQLDSFNAKSIFSEYLPTDFKLLIKNTGNIHIVPQGNIFIDSLRKKDVATLSLNPSSLAVLPGSTREITVRWLDGFPSLNDKGERDWNFEKLHLLRFGKYTANLLMVYDNGERDIPIESTLTFWIFPWRLMLLILAIPATPAILVYLVMKKKSKLS